MKFSEIHGSNVQLDDTKQKAFRNNSFYDGIVFSDNPIRINSFIPIKVCSPANQWLGSVCLGVTSRNPKYFLDNSLPKHIIGLCSEEDFWIKSVPSRWSDSNLIIHVTYEGLMEISCSQEPNVRLAFLTDLPVGSSLWLIVDLYGSSNSVQLATYGSPNSSEMLLLGPDMSTAFKCGSDGVVPYNRTRIVLIGPKNSGKSSLKKVLINNSNMLEDNDNTIGLDSSLVCMSTNDNRWMASTSSGGSQVIQAKDELTLTESQLYHNLAQNIVREINIKNKEQMEEMTPNCAPGVKLSSKELVKNVLRFSSRKMRKYSKEVKLNEMNEVPEELTLMVENLLKNQSLQEVETSRKSIERIPEENSFKFIFNIWDFTGHTLYFLLHQVCRQSMSTAFTFRSLLKLLFTAYAVYVLVIDISEDLDQPLELSKDDSLVTELNKADLTTLNLIHHWLTAIHSTVGRYPTPSDHLDKEEECEYQTTLQPQVILVGTHRNAVHVEPITRDQIIKETFDKIHASLESKTYKNHLSVKCLALDCDEMSYDEPLLIQELKTNVEKIVDKERLTSLEIPAPWMEFEQIIEKLKQRGIYFAEINQLHEFACSRIDAFQSYDALNAALHFYHNQGKVFCLDHIAYFTLFDTQHTYDSGVIILDPNWFLQCVYKLCSFVKSVSDDDNAQYGILSETIINSVWSDCAEQKFILLGCLEKLDIIFELRPYIQIEDAPDVTANTTVPKLYFFPWITRPIVDSEPMNPQIGDSCQDSSFHLVIDFNQLPVGLFSRLLVRLSRWSWNQGWGRRPEMYNSEGRIAVDFDHDLLLKICLKFNRIFLMIIKIFDELQGDQMENFLMGPTANVCVKVQHLIETELENLRNCFYRRLHFKLVVPCPCDVTCQPHNIDGCNDLECLHFLPLNECLTKKVVECKYSRQVRTLFIQRYFPNVPFNSGHEESNAEIIQSQNRENGWDHIFQVEPLWMREAAKLLAPNHPNKDWIALAKRLGYSERDVTKFIDDVSPCLALLRDWYETNGRTRYCVDVLLSCLRMISREDVSALIEYDLEPEGSAPPVFISYQRDSQEQVSELRRKLELAGFPCWMDTRSMGAGDSLYGKIYDGISRAKVVLCCLTPRYAASPMCGREVTLADVLHKPILPIIMEVTPWPPPGAMAVIMSSILYVDLCGVGSHSGIGRTQDSESRFREILDRVSRYIAGYVDAPVVAPRYLQLPDIFSPIRETPQPINASQNVAEISIATSFDTEPQRETQGAVASQVGSHLLSQKCYFRYALQTTNEETLQEDVFSGDNISVLSNSRRTHNRIANCVICSIL